MTTRTGLGLLAILTAWPAAGAPPAKPSPSPSPSAGAESTAERAKKEFEIANGYFQAEEYEVALGHYQSAYELSGHRPSATRGLAQCERALERYDEAIAHFREYVSSKPTPSDAGAVERTIALLEEKRALRTAQEAQRKQQEATRAQARKEEARKQEEARRAEQAHKAAEKPPAPPIAAPSARPGIVGVESPPAEDQGGSLFTSPVFWVVTGVLAAGGAVILAVALAPGAESNNGNTGVFLQP